MDIMQIITWFTFIVGLFFSILAFLMLLIPVLHEEKEFSFFMVLEMIFTLTSTIVALQAIRTGG